MARTCEPITNEHVLRIAERYLHIMVTKDLHPPFKNETSAHIGVTYKNSTTVHIYRKVIKIPRNCCVI